MPVFANMDALRKAINNSDVTVNGDNAQRPSHQPEVAIGQVKESTLESAFAAMWDMLGGPELKQEYRFHPERRWRADFAHPTSRVLIEVEGGT